MTVKDCRVNGRMARLVVIKKERAEGAPKTTIRIPLR
jgi:hypothetical protein